METCRICLLSITSKFVKLDWIVENRNLADLITFCCGIEIDVNDGLLQTVCFECLPQILTAHKIKTLCINSDKALRASLKDDDPSSTVKIECEPEVLLVKSMSRDECDDLRDVRVKEEDNSDDYDSFPPEPLDDTENDNLNTHLEQNLPKNQGKKTSVVASKSRKTSKIPYKCYLCNETFRQRQLKYEHLTNIHSQDDFKCKICPRKSQTARGFDNHLMLHENPHLLSNMCHICSRSFHLPSKLRAHIAQCHSDKSNFSKLYCDLCGFQTILKVNLTRHIRSVHLKLKPFQCIFCPEKKYASKLILDQHMISKHGQETDFVCTVCGNKFSSKAALKGHKKFQCKKGPRGRKSTSHEYRIQIGDSDRYRCTICMDIFEGVKRFAQHYKAVHRYSRVCNICSNEFSCYANLQKHIKTVHKKILEHSCSFCGKQFADRTVLSYHENTHTGAKPFKCKFELCQFRSGDRSTISKHQKKCSQNPGYS